MAGSVVGSALQRLYKRDQPVEKKASGVYLWRGSMANSLSSEGSVPGTRPRGRASGAAFSEAFSSGIRWKLL